MRIALAEQLLESLDSADQREIDARWAKEAEDRIDAYDRGEIAAFSIDEVFSSLQSLMHLRRDPSYWRDRIEP